MEDNKDLHKKHRQRVKDRFLSEGLDSFNEHNILEFLLFYSIPRIDTNEIAHNLINTFGGLSEVFDAPIEELVKLPHISEHTATLIKLVPALSRAYMLDKQKYKQVFDTPKKLGEYFVNRFIGTTNEVLYLLLLDSSLKEIICTKISEGSVTASNLNVRTVVDKVVKHNACSVIIAHNHPRGLALPSTDDLMLTSKLKSVLKSIDVRLIDHIIVAHDEYVSLVEGGFLSVD